LHLALQPLAQALTVDVGHCVPENAPWQNVGVLEPGDGLDFTQEALRPEHRTDFGVQRLDRNESLVPDISPEVHDGHAAAPEFLLEHVAVGQSGFEMVYGSGQSQSPGGSYAPSLVVWLSSSQ
jgi:hypothetical protein